MKIVDNTGTDFFARILFNILYQKSVMVTSLLLVYGILLYGIELRSTQALCCPWYKKKIKKKMCCSRLWSGYKGRL
jgi:hypothetical protein